MPRSLKDLLRDQFFRLEYVSIIISEYERIHCFFRRLRLFIHMSTQSWVIVGRSLVDVLEHARVIGNIHRDGCDIRSKF